MAADMMFSDPAAPAPACQLDPEFRALLGIVRRLAPRRILEIGVMDGGTLYQWMKACPDSTIVAIDLPDGPFGKAGASQPGEWARWALAHGVDLRLWTGDSHEAEAAEFAAGSSPFDFAFIDGDHSYAGARADWETYAPMVRPGGLVALHDILPHPNYPAVEVDRLWREIKDEHNTAELVSYPGQVWGGIGLAWRS